MDCTQTGYLCFVATETYMAQQLQNTSATGSYYILYTASGSFMAFAIGNDCLYFGSASFVLD